jgi:hypothetical protein
MKSRAKLWRRDPIYRVREVGRGLAHAVSYPAAQNQPTSVRINLSNFIIVGDSLSKTQSEHPHEQASNHCIVPPVAGSLDEVLKPGNPAAYDPPEKR